MGGRNGMGLRGGRAPLSRHEQLQAMEELVNDIFAASSKASVASRIRTTTKILAEWGLKPMPPSVDAIRALAATLKFSGYRSATVYLYSYKTDA